MRLLINKNKIYLTIFFFLFIFAPPFFKGINFMYFVTIFSIINLFIQYRREFIKLVGYSWFRSFNLIFLLTLEYWLFICLVSYIDGNIIEMSNYLSTFYRFFSVFFITEPPIIFILLWAKRKNLSLLDIIECLINAGVIEGVICIISVISPQIKAFLTTVIINNTGYYDNIQFWEVQQNFYGFAASMSDYFGWALGLIAGVCLFYCIYYKRSYIIWIPLLLFTCVMNSTTGIIIFAIAIPLLFQRKRSIKRKNLFLIIILPVIVVVAILFIYKYAPRGLQKITDNFWELINPSNVKAQNTSLRELFSPSFWTLPDEISQLFFGTGHSVLRAQKYGFKHSDVGYINDFWTFGILGSCIIYINYIRHLYSKLSENTFCRKIAFFLACSFLIFNIKGLAFGINPGHTVLILLMFLITFYDETVTQTSHFNKCICTLKIQ